jgi:hypothetical protein
MSNGEGDAAAPAPDQKAASFIQPEVLLVSADF